MSPLDRRGDEQFRYVKNLGHMRLYLDDLEDIIYHLRLSAKRVQLRAGDAYAENGPNDLLSARKSEIKNVRIITEGPAVEVELRYRRARAGTDERSAAAKKLVDSVALLLEPRRRRYIADAKTWLIDAAIAVQLVTLVPYVISEVVSEGYYFGSMYSTFFPLMMFTTAVAAARRSMHIGRVIIIPQTLQELIARKRKARSSVMQQLVIGLIMAIVSALLPILLLALHLTKETK